MGSAISPFAHRRNAPPRFRRRISRSVSCRRRSAVTSCWIDPARVERRDLVSVSIWSRWALVRVVMVLGSFWLDRGRRGEGALER